MTDIQFFGLCAMIFIARIQSRLSALVCSFIFLAVAGYLRVVA
jgi:hypothetical protein